MQLRDFGRLASGNSRILVSLRFRVVKLTKALKPEKSAQKRVQVSAQASDIRIFALTASAVRASSWRFRGRGARARTFDAIAALQVERHEGGAFGERFERPWGKQWAEGPEVSVNFHWWSRRFALQVKNREVERSYD